MPQQVAVIDTIYKGYPLNVMYWAEREEGGYEIIDGQQRTVSICLYVADEFSVEGVFSDYPETFGNLSPERQNRILDYELTVYVCGGTRDDKLEWFKTINIAGEKTERTGASQRGLLRPLGDRCEAVLQQQQCWA